jgi:uncharacterized protein (DUF488 family)
MGCIRRAVAMTVFTIGHSTHSIPEFVCLLAESEVQLVVDVRSLPGSRRNPQFNIEDLPDSLAASNIGYQHLSELGGRRHRAPGAPPSLNTFWKNDAFRNYADYAGTEAFKSGFTKLLELARARRCAIMCSEALWWRCHRRIISDYLLADQVEVIHIMAHHQVQRATLTPAARSLANGTLIYGS